MKYLELREKFLKFFKEKSHQIIPSSLLITEDDSTLFTIAGMQPLTPFLLGKEHKKGNKLANIQKCIRTEDINEVGDESHLTFFEMLGNWGLQNAYWKKESIDWSWEFLTNEKWLNLDKNKFAVSVFKGNENVSSDKESYLIWKEIFEKEKISEKRIIQLGEEDNWWPKGGKMLGPQGPNTEIFYWVGNEKITEKFDSNDKNWVEVWNNVFMEYNKISEEKLEKLNKKNVDTGMGLERILSILQNKEIFETEIFKPIIEKIEEISKKNYNENKREFRIISDHIKASVFILSERIEPSNTKQGYILRRLIRRAIRYGNTIGIKEMFLSKLVDSVIEIYKEIYQELKNEKQFIIEQLYKEEKRFSKTLEKALKILGGDNIFVRDLKKYPKPSIIPEINIDGYSPLVVTGKFAFDFYQTYGFPIEMFLEEMEKRKIGGEKFIFLKEKILKEFYEELEKHQELSRTTSKGMFKGGLKGETEIEKKYHTATHLLHFALRKILGSEVQQKGSNISPERLRFDFSYPKKLTEEQLKEIENLINEKIKEEIPVICEEMNLEEAKKSNAIGLFEEKYKDNVSVYSIGNFSKEICKRPHIKNTKELGKFKIIKEESVSSGIRRIKAILE